MFNKVWQFERFQSVKVTFKVIQMYWHWCHLMGHIRFPISLPLQLCLYLAALPISYSRWPDQYHLPILLLLRPMSLLWYYHVIFSRNFITLTKLQHATLHLIHFTCIQNLVTRFSRSGDMIVGVTIENKSCDIDHALLGVVCHPKARSWYSWLVCKIWRLA